MNFWDYVIYGLAIFTAASSILTLLIGLHRVWIRNRVEPVEGPSWSRIVRGAYGLITVGIMLYVYRLGILDGIWSLVLIGILSWPELFFLYWKERGRLG